MKTYKLDNVVRKVSTDYEGEKLERLGYKEVKAKEKTKEVKKTVKKD